MKDTDENITEQTQFTDNPHDKGYKRIFSIKKNFLDFIKKYVGFDWMKILTEHDIELVDKEYVTDQFDTYESDLVYKVHTETGIIYLFFLFEMQSYNDFTMPFRLLVYMTAIWLDYFKNSDRKARKRKGYRLPAIMPIVLYNGERGWTATRKFSDMVGQSEMFGSHVVDFEYVLVSLKKLKPETIKNTNTLVDNIFLADGKRTRQEWLDGAPELLQRIRAMDRADLNEWITWFSNVVRNLGAEERDKFVNNLREGDEFGMCSSFERILTRERAEGRAEGKAEGRAEGKAEGKAEDTIELLEDIGELSDTLRNLIMGQNDIKLLRKWHRAAARAETIDDFERAIGLIK